MAKDLDNGFAGTKFKLQLRYYLHVRVDIIDMNPLISPARV